MGIPTSSVEAVVQLTLTNNRQVAYCTGTFISDSVVLTAAHCFDTAGDDKDQVHRRKLAFQWDSGLFRGGKLTA